MAKSSINFQKSKGHSYNHNFRKDKPNYLLNQIDRKQNEYWKHEKSAQEIFNEELLKANRKGGRIPKFENSHWEAVLNLNENHSLDDVKKVAKHIEKKFNITCCAIAIHRDEGHYEKDKAIYNYHAHINFVTYKDKKQNWRKELIKPNDLRELQTEVAELLQMERGQDKRISKKERLEHTEYKAVAKEKEVLNKEITELKEELAEEKTTKKEIKEEFEKLRKASIGQNFDKEFYKSLSEEKKAALEKIATKEQLKSAIEKFKEKHQIEVSNGFLRRKSKEPDYKKLADGLENEVIKQAEIIDTLKNAIEYENKNRQEVIKEDLAEEREKLEKEKREFLDQRMSDYNYKRQLNSLKEENQELKQENSKFKEFIIQLKQKIHDLTNEIALLKPFKDKYEQFINKDNEIDLNQFKSVLENNKKQLYENLFGDEEKRQDPVRSEFEKRTAEFAKQFLEQKKRDEEKKKLQSRDNGRGR